MKRFLNVIAPIFLMVCVCSPAFSQWSSFKMAGVPRNPDGKPDLTAPAPRIADGKPDLSGLWDLVRPPAGQRGQRGQRGQDGQATAPPALPAPANAARRASALVFQDHRIRNAGRIAAATLGCRSGEEAGGR